MQKQEVYLESYEAKLNQLNTAWEKFSTKSTDASFFKGLVSGANAFVEALNKVNINLSTIAKTVAAFAGMKLFSGSFKLPKIFQNVADTVLSGFSFIPGASKKLQTHKLDEIPATAATEGLRKVEKMLIATGKSSSKTAQLLETSFTKTGRLRKAERLALDKDAIARYNVYKQNHYTTEQMVAAEYELARAREASQKATIKSATAELKKKWTATSQDANLTGWGKLKAHAGQIGGYAKSVGTNLLQAASVGLMAGQIAGSLTKTIAGWFIHENSNNYEAIGKKIDEIKKELENGSAKQTKDNLDIIDKVISQSAEGSELSVDMQKELAKVIEVLDKNLDVNSGILLSSEEGNITLESLKAIQEKYYGAVSLESYYNKNAGTLARLQELNQDEYYAYGGVRDHAAAAEAYAEKIAMTATAGAAAFGPWGLLAGIGGAIWAGIEDATGKFRKAGTIGDKTSLEEAIKKTEASYNSERNEEVKAQLDKELEELKKIRDEITELETSAKEDLGYQLGLIAKSEAQRLEKEEREKNRAERASGKTTASAKTITSNDLNMIQAIAETITQSLSLDQISDASLMEQLSGEINKLVESRLGADQDTNKSYTEFANLFGKGSFFAELLGENSSALRQVGVIISANMPTLAKAVSDLKESIDKELKEFQRASKASDAQKTLLDSLSQVGFNLDMSAEDVSAMLNIGGDIKTGKILDPAYREYANSLQKLYEDYWGENGKIANSTYLDSEEQLIAEYERAVSLKQKEYEIMQKQLEVQEAQNKLYQAQRERDTLVFRDGHFMYEANPSTIQGLQKEAEDALQAQQQLEVSRKIQSYTDDIKNNSDRMSAALEKISSLLDGDITSKISDVAEMRQMIEDDLLDEDGKITNQYLIKFFEKLGELSEDERVKIYDQLGFDENEIHFDSGGLLKGKGYFRKDSIGDEVVLSPTDAPQVLSLLSKTGEFAETVYNANTLLRALTMRDSQIGSLLADSTGGNTIYNVENVNVEEASDIESILDSAQRQINMINPKFVRR